MKIYLSEKEAKENDVVVAKNNYLQDSRIQSNSKNVEFILKSLEQHDNEICKQEREKVIAELENWIKSPYIIDDIYCLNREYVIQTADLVEKLTQLKGEKDE